MKEDFKKEGWYPLNLGATGTFTYPDATVAYTYTTDGIWVYAYEP